MYGMGNWDDISEHVATKKPEECRDHYYSQYVEVPTCPLPDVSRTFTKQEIDEAAQNYQNTGSIPKPSRKQKTQGSQPIKQELAGYMPRRGEFEVEYDNDAEYILTDMTFNDDDTPTERELKIASLVIYNQKMEKRKQMRDFVVHHDLMDLKKMQIKDANRSEDAKTIYNKTRKLLQFVEMKELEDFVQDLAAESSIRQRIEIYLNYRKNGIRSMADAANFDSLNKRRETQMRKRRDSSNIYGYPERSKERGSRWVNRDKEPSSSTQTPNVDIANAPGFDLLSTGERQVCDYLYWFKYLIFYEYLYFFKFFLVM